MTEIQTEISGLETTVGQILKNTRLEKKLTTEQIAKQLKLSVYTIRDLENDNYDDLPVMTYVRGYIVSYCRILGLDSFEVLSHLNMPDLSKKKSSVETLQNNESKSEGLFSTKKLLILCFIVAIVFGVKYFLPLLNKELGLENNASNTEVVGKSEVPTEDNKEELLTPDMSEASDESNESTTSIELENKIELSFESVSWVDVQTENKEKIVYQSFASGETHTVKAELPLNIFIDNASSVTLIYEGNKIDLEQYTKDGYAKFTLEK